MSYNAWFQCINGCPGQYSLLEVIYRCPSCRDLLEKTLARETIRAGSGEDPPGPAQAGEVQHDMAALRSRTPAAWIGLFEDRSRRNAYPYGPGVWGKKEWVAPFIDNENIVSMFEGNSNLFWAERYGKQLHVEDLWVKQCAA